MLLADFPKKKENQLSEEIQKHNHMLAEKNNQEGYFPLVVVLDIHGKVLGKTGYQNISVEKYIEILESFKGNS
jgi:hypothetical protein